MTTIPVEGTSDHYFSTDAAHLAAREIREAGGVEVFFIGRRNEAGLITEVESHAFGSKDTVPAVINLVRPGEVFIHNHPSGVLLPSDADLHIASIVGNMGVGCYIVDNECQRCRIVVKPQDPKKKVMLKEEDVLKRLAPQGQLSQAINDFEDRPQQRSMAASIVRAFNHDGISVVEAGTGTGKSFAYLVPAILFGLKNDERVVVSTATINLQEQLYHKDIPSVRRALGEEFEVEIVKGRSNFVCKRKASFASSEANTLLEDDFIRELKDLLEWISTSPTGDRSELPVTPRHQVWERVQSEADNCLRVRCPFYEECFFYNSRRRAARAKVLIVNHSLLMSDLAVRRASGNWSTAAVLPPYRRVVIDEAHHLEEIATKNLANQLTRPGLRNLFGRLYRRENKGGGHGVLATLSEELNKLIQKRLLDPTDARISTLNLEIIPRLADVRDSVDFLLDDFGRQFMRLQGISELKPGFEEKIRIRPEMFYNELWTSECQPLLHALAGEIAKYHDDNIKLIDQFEEFDEKVLNTIINPFMEWQAVVGRLDAVRKTAMGFNNDDVEYCRWVELQQPTTSGRATIVRLCMAPVDVRELLRESLHDRMKSEVLTSATLAVDRAFSFFQERTGLPLISPEKPPVEYDEEGLPIIDVRPVEARSVETSILPSPFDYQRQVFFAVPSDMPDPREKHFEDELADLIINAVNISGGRAFILFTSYGQLNRVYTKCEHKIRRLGIEVLRQGKTSRDQLLARFREDETSVLFATTSFWEGVDVKGRALELLIICKLPFTVPTEPIQEAQYEALQAQGRDPFEGLVVPRAVIRFKQGFGRLIRSSNDRGAVIIADPRVIKMRYGRRFLYSLPEADLRKGTRERLMEEMGQFFKTNRHQETPSDEEYDDYEPNDIPF